MRGIYPHAGSTHRRKTRPSFIEHAVRTPSLGPQASVLDVLLRTTPLVVLHDAHTHAAAPQAVGHHAVVDRTDVHHTDVRSSILPQG